MVVRNKFMSMAVDPHNRVGLAQHEICEVLALSKGEVVLAERRGLEKVRLGLASHLQERCPHLQGQPVDDVLSEFIGGMIA